jgi:plasmid stabilization system protein ParE
MALRVTISARAAAEVRKADAWWAKNRPAAPSAVAVDFSEAIALLAQQPGLGATYVGNRVAGVRRLFLNRVGYFIYYKPEADVLKVLAFWHARREHPPVL